MLSATDILNLDTLGRYCFMLIIRTFFNSSTDYIRRKQKSHITLFSFSEYCNNIIGCDYVATGHYARTETDTNAIGQRRVKLLQAIDRVKDQTFFLSQIRQQSLSNALFPLGNYTKDVVKKIASSAGLDWVARKKESMGICFIGKKRDGFAKFIREYSKPR